MPAFKAGGKLSLFGKKANTARTLPRHIAIVMDGNGRWAKKRGLPRSAGHVAGAKTFKTIARYCNKIGLEYLTVYAFSTENWKRPERRDRRHYEPFARLFKGRGKFQGRKH